MWVIFCVALPIAGILVLHLHMLRHASLCAACNGSNAFAADRAVSGNRVALAGLAAYGHGLDEP